MSYHDNDRSYLVVGLLAASTSADHHLSSVRGAAHVGQLHEPGLLPHSAARRQHRNRRRSLPEAKHDDVEAMVRPADWSSMQAVLTRAVANT
jgi:hypothetical protein